MKIGIISEGKVPHDKRVTFTPDQINQLKTDFPGSEFVIQPSPYRCYSDHEYQQAGILLQEDMSDCDMLMGVKEVPNDQLLEGKQYSFFSLIIPIFINYLSNRKNRDLRLSGTLVRATELRTPCKN